jgi:hypothetical protein
MPAAAAAIGLATGIADAKCITDHYFVSGRVVDAAGDSVPKAQVRISWRDYLEAHESLALTDANGSFSEELLVNRFSDGISMTGMYNCDFVLSYAEVRAQAVHLRSAQVKAAFSGGKAKVTLTVTAGTNKPAK